MRSTMKRWPGALSRSTSSPASRNSSATNSANSSLSRRRVQSGRSRRRGSASWSCVDGDVGHQNAWPSETVTANGPSPFCRLSGMPKSMRIGPKQRIIADADAGREAPVLEVRAAPRWSASRRRRRGRSRNCRRTASAGFAPRARTRQGRVRRSGRRPVLGTELLIAVAAHRPAAARIETPRRRNVEDAGADDRAEPDAAGDDDLIGNRTIGARVELGARIGELAAVRRRSRG